MYSRLKRGRDVTSRRAERIIQWFSDNWPVDLDWPADIPRPEPAPESPAARSMAGPSPVTPTVTYAEAKRLSEAAMKALDDAWDEEYDGDKIDRLERAAKAAARLLNNKGQIACPDAFCRKERVKRQDYDAVIRRYADGRLRQKELPQFNTSALVIFYALVDAGDVRFASRAGLRLSRQKEARGKEERNRQVRLMAQAGARQ